MEESTELRREMEEESGVIAAAASEEEEERGGGGGGRCRDSEDPVERCDSSTHCRCSNSKSEAGSRCCGVDR